MLSNRVLGTQDIGIYLNILYDWREDDMWVVNYVYLYFVSKLQMCLFDWIFDIMTS